MAVLQAHCSRGHVPRGWLGRPHAKRELFRMFAVAARALIALETPLLLEIDSESVGGERYPLAD